MTIIGKFWDKGISSVYLEICVPQWFLIVFVCYTHFVLEMELFDCQYLICMFFVIWESLQNFLHKKKKILNFKSYMCISYCIYYYFLLAPVVSAAYSTLVVSSRIFPKDFYQQLRLSVQQLHRNVYAPNLSSSLDSLGGWSHWTPFFICCPERITLDLENPSWRFIIYLPHI